MSKTQKNLVKAFLFSSKNQNLYDYFSSQAKKEGLITVQKLFEEFALYERSHAKNFLRLIESKEISVDFDYDHIPIKSTVENIESLINEIEKIEYLYDDFIEVADKENQNKASAKFVAIKKSHEYKLTQLKKILSQIEENKMFKNEEKIFWKCLKCGYIIEGETPPELCPACGHPKGYFEKIFL